MAARPVGIAGWTGVVHVHSSYSHDGRDSLHDIHRFAISRGIGFVGLTDHAEDFDAAIFNRYLAECTRHSTDEVRLLPGLEFRFVGYPGLHLLALGLTEWIEPRTPEEFLALVRGRAGLTIAAHPRLFRYRLPPAVAERIDAIEVWNAVYDTRYLPDPRAMQLLRSVRTRRPEVVGTAGLDQHDSRNDRETRVVLQEPTSDPLAALRAGRFTNVGRTMRFSATVDWGRLRIGGLLAARQVFDRVERLQDRATRVLARRRKRQS